MKIKINKIILTLLVLIATSMLSIFIYDFFSNIGSDSLANVTANNNVIINQISDISARFNSNVTNELTTNDTNSNTELPTGSSKSTVILVVSIAAFCLVIFSGVGIQAYSHFRNAANAAVTENIELESIPAQIRT